MTFDEAVQIARLGASPYGCDADYWPHIIRGLAAIGVLKLEDPDPEPVMKTDVLRLTHLRALLTGTTVAVHYPDGRKACGPLTSYSAQTLLEHIDEAGLEIVCKGSRWQPPTREEAWNTIAAIPGVGFYQCAGGPSPKEQLLDALERIGAVRKG